jgi:MFS family permease
MKSSGTALLVDGTVADRASKPEISTSLCSLYFAIFFDSLGSCMLLPVMTFRALELGASDFEVGLLSSVFSVFYMMGTAVLGFLCQAIGCRRVLVLCLATTALSLACFAFSETYEQLLCSRGLAGFFAGTQSMAQVLVTNTVPAEARSEALAKTGAALGGAFAVGSVLSSLLVPYGLKQLALCAAVLTTVNSVLGVVTLPREKCSTRDVSIEENQAVGTFMSLKSAPLRSHLCTSQSLLGYFLCDFLYNLGFGVYVGTSALYFHDFYGMEASDFAVVSMVAGLVFVFIQIFALKPVVAALGDKKTMVLAWILKAGAFAAWTFLHFKWLPYVVVVVMTFGSAFFMPTLVSLIAEITPSEIRGSVLSLNNAIGSLGFMLGPAAAGALYQIEKHLPCLVGIWVHVLGGLLAFLIAVSSQAPASAPEFTQHEQGQQQATEQAQSSGSKCNADSTMELKTGSSAVLLAPSCGASVPHESGSMDCEACAGA